MATRVSPQLAASLRRCVDDCARDTADELGRIWSERSRDTQFGEKTTGKYNRCFTGPDVSGGNGNYLVEFGNTADHASFLEDGSRAWQAKRRKWYRMELRDTRFDTPGQVEYYGSLEDGDDIGTFTVPAREGRNIIGNAMCEAIAAVSK